MDLYMDDRVSAQAATGGGEAAVTFRRGGDDVVLWAESPDVLEGVLEAALVSLRAPVEVSV